MGYQGLGVLGFRVRDLGCRDQGVGLHQGTIKGRHTGLFGSIVRGLFPNSPTLTTWEILAVAHMTHECFIIIFSTMVTLLCHYVCYH